MQGGGAFAAPGVAPHERAPRLFVERIESEQLLRLADRLAKVAFLLEEGDELGQHFLRALSQTLTVGIDPLAGGVRQQVAAVQSRGFVKGITIAGQSTLRGCFERHQVHDRGGAFAPRERAGASLHERVEIGPAFPQMMQLAAQVGQGLDVGRIRPQRTSDPLTRNRTAPRMQDQEGNGLLLPCGWQAGERTAVGDETKASEEFDAQRRLTGHVPRLHAMAGSKSASARYNAPIMPIRDDEPRRRRGPFGVGLGAAIAAGALPLAVATPRASLPEGSLTVPAGFAITLVAGPPMVNRPIAADFDEQGRLYVTDSSGSNDKVEKQLEERPHRIVRLEDRDGDGIYDTSRVFADRMMLPEGAMWFDGSLYVAAPPSIWKLTDTDDDGVADRREEWFAGKTLTFCANDLHGPYLGPDGWIYWTKGAFASQTYERPGKAPLVTRAAHIFRRRPGSALIEPVMTGGMDNPVEVAFTPDGERLFTSTFVEHPQAGRRDALVHAIYGGVYGKPHDVIDGHPQTGDLMPVLSELGAAVPSSLMRYQSRVFGPAYQDNLFVAQFNLQKVTRHVLSPNGATFTAKDTDFVTSTNRDFHPTDVLEDADGSLLVIDTGAWYKLCCPTSQLAKPDVLGGIYRVTRRGAARPRDPRGLGLDWPALPAGRLVRALDDPRPAVQQRAIQQLAKTGAGAIGALSAALTGTHSVEARRNAVWALSRIDGPDARAAVRAALDDSDPTVRHAALHAAALWRDAGALPQVRAALASKSPAIQRVAAEALGRIGDARAVPDLLAATAPRAGPDARALADLCTHRNRRRGVDTKQG